MLRINDGGGVVSWLPKADWRLLAVVLVAAYSRSQVTIDSIYAMHLRLLCDPSED